MRHRCTNHVGTARCAVRVRNYYGAGPADHIEHWPHRYVEDRLVARLRHEWSLRRHGFTTTTELLLALIGRASNPGRSDLT